MVTGAPGAGKSLCANSVLSKIDCTIIKLNANIVKTLSEVQEIIAEKLIEKGGGAIKTMPQLIQELNQIEYKSTCIVYIEEVEILFKAAPTPVTEDFMKLFQKKNLNIILIGISNTIDTLLKSSNKFCFKMHDIENVIFPPYTG